MRASLVAIGTELLLPGRRDTNGDWLADRLDGLGVDVVSRSRVADDEAEIAAILAAAIRSSDVVIATGGLGPTEDDRTRRAAADALQRTLERDRAMLARLEDRFRARGFPFGDTQGRQADRPEGAAWISNPLGSAPGFLAEERGHLLAVLPGVPAEMRAMAEAAVFPRLGDRGRRGVARRTLHVGGRRESSVDEQLRDLYGEPGVSVTILASAGSGVDLVLRVTGSTPDDASRRLALLEGEMSRRLGDDLYGRDDETLPSVTGRLLASAGRTIATAESCTAGLLAAAITDVPGSSAWYRGGTVAYSNELKTALLGVPPDLLEGHGAVSAPVAGAMARGVRERCGTDYGVGVTGIAGPGGGTADKPVGLVHVAVASHDGETSLRAVMPGDRDLVRRRTVVAALDLVRRRLLER